MGKTAKITVLATGIFMVAMGAGVFALDDEKNPFGDIVKNTHEKIDGVKASNGLVTGTTGAAAQQAGVDVLKAGGNAADASIATAMHQICLAAGSWVSYAGIMNVVYYEAATGKIYNMNASYNTVEGEKDPSTIPAPDFSKGLMGVKLEPTGRNVLVPGFLKGAEALVKKFGNLPLSKVAESTINCAENGFTWNKGLTQQAAFRQDVLSRDPETKAVYFKEDGSPYQPGEMFKQPALAETLRRFAAEGSDYIYKGEWAEKLVAKTQALGGKLTMRDMEKYDVIWSKPIHGTYNGYDLYVHGQPALGGVDTLETLNLIEAAELAKKGAYFENPEAYYWLTQLMRVSTTLTYGAKDLAAPLGLDLSPEGRLDKTQTQKLWPIIKEGNFPNIPAPKTVPVHSDGVVVIDKWGNISAVLHSINAVSWGTNGINVDGISIPDSAAIQVAVVEATTPGERLPDPTNPGIVMKDGKPFMGFTSIGAGLRERTVSGLVSVMDQGMTPQEAINAPAYGYFNTFAPGGAVQTMGVGELNPEIIEQVKKMGLTVEENAQMLGYWIAIQIDPETGELHGGSTRSLDMSMGGRAVGY